MEVMNEAEQKKAAIDKFISIQRIKAYGEAELEYQEKVARAELEILGISVENLELKIK